METCAILARFSNGKCVPIWKHNMVWNCCSCFSHGFRVYDMLVNHSYGAFCFQKYTCFPGEKGRQKKRKYWIKWERKDDTGKFVRTPFLYLKKGVIGTLNKKGSAQLHLKIVKREHYVYVLCISMHCTIRAHFIYYIYLLYAYISIHFIHSIKYKNIFFNNHNVILRI